MSRLRELCRNFKFVWEEEGLISTCRRVGSHGVQAAHSIADKVTGHSRRQRIVDVCFINGCDRSLPHPIRYRVDHQAEQLEATGVSTRIVDAWDFTEDVARLARTFVLFRCPWSPFVNEMIDLIHGLNKKIYFDIDDLVIDTVYTDRIPYLDTMSPTERAQYDEGVRLMGKTMRLCDGAITTTEQLATELRKYVEPVLVNHNVASEEMVYLSERASYERDVLPTLPREEVPFEDRHRWKLARERQSERKGFSIGYFSGSITHNDDFEMILPAIVRFMRDCSDVSLHVVGELDLPDELAPFADRIVRLPFSPWRRLPQMIASVDVNLIPLTDTIFNAAKSENKWVEAALVKVPSVASDVGALGAAIIDGVDGLLCSSVDAWYEALIALRSDTRMRHEIARSAHARCMERYATYRTGNDLANFICTHQTTNIGFAVPAFNVSGGMVVILKHAELMREAGYDVTFFDTCNSVESGWISIGERRYPVVPAGHTDVDCKVDKMVATMWSTLKYCIDCRAVGHRYYLVQNLESNFYAPSNPERLAASATYGVHDDITYCTISPWCRRWLKDEYGHAARYAPNGIDLSLFAPEDRDWSGKVRILIEGDSTSDYKNVDEAFRITNQLDSNRYEIWYLSYKGGPKAFYRVDKFLKQVPHEEIGAVYGQCHILLKTSLLESFSYPPLEMMATGGHAVVLRNEGNAAYVVDGENALLFDAGEDDKAVRLIESITEDQGLRERLREGGLATARKLAWESVSDEILALYD